MADLDPIFEDTDDDSSTVDPSTVDPSTLKAFDPDSPSVSTNITIPDLSFKVRSSLKVRSPPASTPSRVETPKSKDPSKVGVFSQIQTLLKQQSSKLPKTSAKIDVSSAAAAFKNIRPRSVVSEKQKKRAKKTGRDVTKMIVNAHRNQILSFTSLFLSSFTELYPSLPRYNVSLSFLSLYLFTSKNVQIKSTKIFYTGFCTSIILSILIDLDWIVSQDRPIPIDGIEEVYIPGIGNQGGNNLYAETQGIKNLANVCRVALVFNMILKLLICYALLSRTKDGLNLLKVSLFKPLKYFIPSINMSSTSKIKNNICKRLIANAWIQFICSAGMFTITIIAMLAMTSHPHFLNDSAGVPLTILMLFKGFSNFVVFLGILRNVDIGDFLNEFGCLIPCKNWYKNRKKRLRTKRGFSAPKIIIDEDYISSIRGVKLFDFLVGLWCWIGLIHALKFGGGRATKGVRILTGLSVTFMCLSDILVVMNLGVIGWYVRVVEERRRRRRRMEGEEGGSTSEEEEDSESDSSDSESESENEEDNIETQTQEEGNWEGDEYGYYDEYGTYHYYEYDEGEYAEGYDYGEEQQQEQYYSAAATYRGQVNDGKPNSFGGFFDRAVACTPEEFSGEWDSLEVGGEFTTETTESPLMIDIMTHLSKNSFFVIASGIVDDGIMKFYVLAQAQGMRCYISLGFDTSGSVLNLVLKCKSEGMIGRVVKELRLKDVFGGFSASNT